MSRIKEARNSTLGPFSASGCMWEVSVKDVLATHMKSSSTSETYHRSSRRKRSPSLPEADASQYASALEKAHEKLAAACVEAPGVPFALRLDCVCDSCSELCWLSLPRSGEGQTLAAREPRQHSRYFATDLRGWQRLLTDFNLRRGKEEVVQ